MLTPATINIQSYFYPVGNTPAISLTQSVPPGDPADILLLGCGDLRNILFTIHNNGPQQLDITCCDNQKAIIARNILLLTLIIDDEDGQNNTSMWNLYYHMYLDKLSLDLLCSQSKKLHDLSNTLDAWQQSKYGQCISFCDTATLVEVRKMWAFYSTGQKGAGFARFKAQFKSVLDRAKARRKQIGCATGMTIGFRCAFPAHLELIDDLSALSKHYWNHGTTDVRADLISAATHPNPAILSVGDGAVLHYGTDPLLGFHLAGVGAPLDSTDSSIKQLPRREQFAALARAEFGEWVMSFRQCSRGSNTKLRFFVGDAVSFSHTLQHKRVTLENTAHWYRDRYGARPLVLDGTGYSSPADAPLAFDVIDTSNLCDHLGSLILLTATSPLLRDHAGAILYTEVLANNHKTSREVLEQVLCGHVPTLSTLLDLFPIEYWTNTLPTSIGDETLFDTVSKGLSGNIGSVELYDQLFLRTSWKRAVCMHLATAPSQTIPLRFGSKELAKVLYEVYVHMFLAEDMMRKFANITLHSISKSSLVWYQRSSFASFLRLVQTRVSCDWKAVMDHTMDLVENRPNAPMGMNYYQELNTYLYVLGTYATDIMANWQNREQMSLMSSFKSVVPLDGEDYADLRDWKNIPPAVCVTLKIPRKKLAVFTNMKVEQLGTPAVHCQIQAVRSMWMPGGGWQNIYPAIQLSFGKVSTRGRLHDNSYELIVQEDEEGWNGKSDLIASFFTSTFHLLQDPQKVEVTFGVHSTPASTATFVSKLGLTLQVFQTTLDDSNSVYVTRYAPNQTGFPVVSGFARTSASSGIEIGAHSSLAASIDQRTGHMTTLTGRLEITSNDLQQALADGCKVQKSVKSPCEISVSLGESPTLSLYFPTFVKETGQKLRIARKSRYVEVVAHVADCSIWASYPYYIYPVQSHSGKVVNGNMSYLKLQKCPLIQIDEPKKLGWLNTHIAMVMSSRERALRDNNSNNFLPSAGEQVRLDLKESLFSLFMHFSGVQGAQNRIMYLNNPTNGGVHIIIITSALRLDLANRVVLADCAVLPLTHTMMPNIADSLTRMQKSGVITTRVNDAEMKLWRHVLPAYVERCRDWSHRENCEYTSANSIPLNTENGKPVLCTCGAGKFPLNFITDVPGWDTLSKYAVRAAISPAFWAPFADDIYAPDLSHLNDAASEVGQKTRVDGAGRLSIVLESVSGHTGRLIRFFVKVAAAVRAYVAHHLWC
ncbi:hypothetical protein F5Y08DRAFT_348429 [Xylaria arbuscula]|nr:hypothetical protein F5Y08DRAFT_348429 [Xylaria arbuscula]